MEIFESIGFINYWGFSPRFDLLKHYSWNKENNQIDPINIFLSASSDLGHIIKTSADHRCQKINYYVHEKQKEPLARQLLFLMIINCKTLNYRERCELYLDIFGNSMIREKSQQFIQQAAKILIQLLSEYKDKSSDWIGIKKIMDLSLLKYKDIDALVEILQSYDQKVEFKMECLRDSRLRGHYKTRYDFRTNLVDWDYQMDVVPNAVVVHWIHYRDWRQQGVAYETRFSKYVVPNRTMSSYIPGKRKVSRDSVMVRGYWGDITCSPYLSFGVQTDYEPEKTLLFKTINMQQASNSVEISQFQIIYWLAILQENKEIRAETSNDYLQQQQKQHAENAKKEAQHKSNKTSQKVELEVIEEKEEQNQNQDQEEKKEEKKEDQQINYDFSGIIEGLENIRIIPICDEIDRVTSHKKIPKMDVSWVGFMNSKYISDQGFIGLSEQAYFENHLHIVGMEKEQKKQYGEQFIKMVDQNGWSKQGFYIPSVYRLTRNMQAIKQE